MFAQPWRFLILQPQEEIKGKLFLQKFTLEDFSILQYKNLGPLFDFCTVSSSLMFCFDERNLSQENCI